MLQLVGKRHNGLDNDYKIELYSRNPESDNLSRAGLSSTFDAEADLIISRTPGAHLSDQTVPAGWYTDPNDSSKLRWWDGQDWLERYAPNPPSSPATTNADASADDLVNPERSPDNFATQDAINRNSAPISQDDEVGAVASVGLKQKIAASEPQLVVGAANESRSEEESGRPKNRSRTLALFLVAIAVAIAVIAIAVTGSNNAKRQDAILGEKFTTTQARTVVVGDDTAQPFGLAVDQSSLSDLSVPDYIAGAYPTPEDETVSPGECLNLAGAMAITPADGDVDGNLIIHGNKILATAGDATIYQDVRVFPNQTDAVFFMKSLAKWNEQCPREKAIDVSSQETKWLTDFEVMSSFRPESLTLRATNNVGFQYEEYQFWARKGNVVTWFYVSPLTGTLDPSSYVEPVQQIINDRLDQLGSSTP